MIKGSADNTSKLPHPTVPADSTILHEVGSWFTSGACEGNPTECTILGGIGGLPIGKPVCPGP